MIILSMKWHDNKNKKSSDSFKWFSLLLNPQIWEEPVKLI